MDWTGRWLCARAVAQYPQAPDETERPGQRKRSLPMAKYLLHRGGLVLLKTSTLCGMPIFLKVNHQLESRMQEICQSGSEGGAKPTFVPTPIDTPKEASRRVRCDSRGCAHRFDDWSDEISNTKLKKFMLYDCWHTIQILSMPNTFSCLNIHYVFSTKERVWVLNPDIRERLWPYMDGIAKQNGMIPKCIGGVSDHVHLLVTLPTRLAVAKAVQLIKAGSSAWVHQTFPNLRNFARQQGYGAFRVGISQVQKRGHSL